jgi:hypothetical protein
VPWGWLTRVHHLKEFFGVVQKGSSGSTAHDAKALFAWQHGSKPHAPDASVTQIRRTGSRELQNCAVL